MTCCFACTSVEVPNGYPKLELESHGGAFAPREQLHMSQLTVPISTAIIGQERYPTRFEKFCNALIGELEGGVPVVSTSASWDLGRDGRAQTPRGTIYTCCSLRDDVDEKALDDVRRLLTTLSRNRIESISAHRNR